MAKENVPVYLFTGFLEAGKTKMIQETLEDKDFNDGAKILLIVCEEGVEEYDPTKFWGQNVRMVTVENESDLTLDFMTELANKHKVDRVMIEYNGMWLLRTLDAAMPANWFINQQILFIDATTAMAYNANMRSLMVDKLQTAETVIFNRAKGADKEQLHKLVRGISRRAQIAYESDDDMEYDDIEDPLPFDVNAPVVTVEDEDYALFYRDLSESLEEYEGRTIKFKGLVARDRALGRNAVVVGRHVMTCCEADIAYNGLVCNFQNDVNYKTGEWIIVTAKIKLEKHKLYGSRGPVLYATDVALTSAPKNPVATFY